MSAVVAICLFSFGIYSVILNIQSFAMSLEEIGNEKSGCTMSVGVSFS